MINLFKSTLLASLLFSYAGFSRMHENPIKVPKVKSNYTIMTDGLIESKEWKNAKQIMISQADLASLLIRQDDDFIYIAIKAPFKRLSYIDMYLDLGDSKILNLHTSSHIGERTLTDTLYTDMSPPFRFGNNKEWYANEIRFDRIEAQELLAQDPNRDRNQMQLQTNFYYHGFEYILKKSRFNTKARKMRIEIKTGRPGCQNIFYPEGSKARIISAWQAVIL